MYSYSLICVGQKSSCSLTMKNQKTEKRKSEIIKLKRVEEEDEEEKKSKWKKTVIENMNSRRKRWKANMINSYIHTQTHLTNLYKHATKQKKENKKKCLFLLWYMFPRNICRKILQVNVQQMTYSLILSRNKQEWIIYTILVTATNSSNRIFIYRKSVSNNNKWH